MDDEDSVAQVNTSKLGRNIAPKARSLRVHGVFSKAPTMIGIAATKASFLLRQFLQTDINMPQNVNRLFNRTGLGQDQPKAEVATDTKAQEKIKDSEHDQAIDKKKDIERLKKLVNQSHEVLMQITTVFPFTLFPDTITIDRTKVNIHRRSFFFVSDIRSVRIEDILHVSCGIGPIFGSITITQRVMTHNDSFKIDFFWRKDAIAMKHLLQGYVIAVHQKIECSHFKRDELVATLSELGHDASG